VFGVPEIPFCCLMSAGAADEEEVRWLLVTDRLKVGYDI